MLDQNLTAPRYKFQDPKTTLSGKNRARIALSNPTTLWFNTGTICNISCANCYIKSSPTNDTLVHITAEEVLSFLCQLKNRKWPVYEIGFTGGEPFINPEILEMIEYCLKANYEVLILTNAMQPMMRKSVQTKLIQLNSVYPEKLILRISLDHFSETRHNHERGLGTFQKTLEGMDWLRDVGINMKVAGRTIWDESESDIRLGYENLFRTRNYNIDARDPKQTVLFPEIDENFDIPEITADCWKILGKDPNTIMCSSSRMVVKRKGSEKPVVLACTLIESSSEFELGHTLKDAEIDVALNHKNCSKFCVLGGANCSP